MFDALCLVLAAAASFLGFACLALSLPRHWRAVSSAALPATRVRGLRGVGYLLLVLGGAFAVLRDGASFGSVLAVLVLITSAWAVAFTLAWRPHWLRPLAAPLGAPLASSPTAPLPTAPPREPRLASLLTSILWLTCLVVGVWGFAFPMPRPTRRAPEPPPIIIEQEPKRIEVALTPEPAPSATAAPADPSRPPPLTPTTAPPPPPALIAVATPIAQTSFVLPVQIRVPVADPRPATPTSAAAPAVTAPAAAPVVQTLTFGQGEGKQPAPSYPSQAQREGQEGEVVVRFQVAEDGRVRSAELARPSPWPLLNRAALQVVRERWSFPSGRARLYEVSIHFELSK